MASSPPQLGSMETCRKCKRCEPRANLQHDLSHRLLHSGYTLTAGYTLQREPCISNIHPACIRAESLTRQCKAPESCLACLAVLLLVARALRSAGGEPQKNRSKRRFVAVRHPQQGPFPDLSRPTGQLPPKCCAELSWKGPDAWRAFALWPRAPPALSQC